MIDAEDPGPELDGGIDRKQLRQIRERFLRSNRARVLRTRESLGARQEPVIDLLPLLFHVNHPLLPGYISGSTPCGIGAYEPDKDALRAASHLTRSFRYQRRINPQDDLHSIFVMGSAGSLGHSGQSDLDIWVCHQSALDEAAIGELRRKCELIGEWCHSSLGLEVHFFPMSPTRFSRGETGNLSTEDCGSAQHFLLLEEFYRTAVLLAGRYPIWWLTPPELEHDHDAFAKRLRQQRFVRADETIDFGGIPAIPAGEFIGAGLWQIYKAIDSPYKSVLKCLLTEVYASEHPRVETMSLVIKQRIYRRLEDPDELDPYVVIYRRLEAYLLERGEADRLELVRRCMYVKAGQKLASTVRGKPSWRRQLMERLVGEWGWRKEQLRDLDHRAQWKAMRVASERREIVNNLTYSYRFLAQFANENRSDALIDPEEMSLLGRKLYATYERRANKIERLNPGIAPDISESEITIALLDLNWLLFNNALIESDVPSTAPLFRSRSLVRLLVSCHLNRLISRHTLLNVYAGEHRHVLLEARRMLEVLETDLPRLDCEVGQDAYRRPALPNQVLVFANVAMECSGIEVEGLSRISDRRDPLSYSMLRDNLVVTMDLVVRNSWNEAYTYRFEEDIALAECLVEFMRQTCLQAVEPALELRAYCFTHSHGANIAQRLQELFAEILQTFQAADDAVEPRFVIEIGARFLLLQMRDGVPGYQLLDDEPAILEQLAVPQATFSPVLLDLQSLRNSALGAVCRAGMSRSVQTFIRTLGDQRFELYLSDAHGCVLHWISAAPSADNVLLPLRRFLEAVWTRQQALQGAEPGEPPRAPEFFRLHGDGSEERPYLASRIRLRADTSSTGHHAVQAIAARDAQGRIGFTIYCNHQEFSTIEHGDGLFRAVARHILGQRRDQARYPCYITDLDLSDVVGTQAGSQPSLALYLQYKQRLESALAAAMQEL